MADKKLGLLNIFTGTGGVKKMKSRKGAALVVALLVVIVGGAIIATTFNLVLQHVRWGVVQRGAYVDPSILRSAMEEVKGRIIAHNRVNGNITHVPVVGPPHPNIANVNALRFEPAAFAAPPGSLVLNQRNQVHDGVGIRFVQVEVFDLTFRGEQATELLSGNLGPIPDFFPPSFFAVIQGGGGGGAADRGIIEGAAEHPGGGGYANPPDDVERGVYLLRAMLFNDDDPNAQPIRVAEEVFEQFLPIL